MHHPDPPRRFGHGCIVEPRREGGGDGRCAEGAGDFLLVGWAGANKSLTGWVTPPYGLSLMSLITTLNFSGRTEAAVNFYREALEAKVDFLMRFRDSPMPATSWEGRGDLVFHATFRVADTVLMASDVGHTSGAAVVPFSGFALALRLSSVEQARRWFGNLAVGGEVVMPLERSEFTTWYGIVTDRFGLSWKFNVDETAA